MQGQKSIYGIIGNPLKHSLSPQMHNCAFKALGLDAAYQCFPLEENELDGFLKDLKNPESPVFGLNVTVPYKERVLGYMDSLSPFAQKASAVNTVVISRERQLAGHNTDGPGFLAHLAELEFSTKAKRVVLLGAGGTARAIIAALCLLPERPQWIRMYNRTSQKAEALLQGLAAKGIDVGVVTVAPTIDDCNIELADLLINTTAVGLNPDDPCLVDESLLHANMLVYDVVYNPQQTALLKLAKAKGAQAANGLGMLFYQGVLAFQHWADTELDPEVKAQMRQSLEEAAAA